MQETRVQSLVQEDPTCHGATKPMRHYWACALEPGTQSYWNQLTLEPALRSWRSYCNEKSAHCNEEEPPLAAAREKPTQQQRLSTAKNT